MSARYFEGVAHAALYSKFRPATPSALTKKIIDYLKQQYHGDLIYAADVGCGSGQSTLAVEPFVSNITGLDISEAQINEAIKGNISSKVSYKISSEAVLPFKKESVHLITVGQAAHWFNLPKFFKEADRILVPNGVIALYGYTLPRPSYGNKSEELCEILDTVYIKDTNGFWGKERKFVDDKYTHQQFVIPYPERTRDDSIVYETSGSLQELRGYVSSWSGFQKYQSVHGDAAAQTLLEEFIDNMKSAIGETNKKPEEVTIQWKFPFFLLMGRKPDA